MATKKELKKQKEEEERKKLELQKEQDELILQEEQEEVPLWKIRKQMEQQQEQEDALRWKLKKERLKQEELQRQENRLKQILQPNIKNNVIEWVDKNKNGQLYQGLFNNSVVFEIRRGTFNFSLKIIDGKIQSEKQNFNAMNIIKLQETANKLLVKNLSNFKK